VDLTAVQVLRKFPMFYVNRKFFTVFRRARLWSLTSVRWMQSMPPHSISLRNNLILYFHLLLSLPSGSFLLPFPPEHCITFPSLPCMLHSFPRLIFLDLIILITFGEEFKLWSSGLCNFYSLLLILNPPCRLRHCAINRKVAGSSPDDVIGYFKFT
jgi:hypothetical protein